MIFLVLGGLSVLVWNQQVEHSRSELSNHTGDVAVQAGRRLGAFVESHLRIAAIFAHRWATHENRDFSRKRFEEFAAVVLENAVGFHSFALVAPGATRSWTVSQDAPPAAPNLTPEQLRVVEQCSKRGRAVLSGPFVDRDGVIDLYAVLPLRRGREDLGFLVVTFLASRLIDDCFASRIQNEFNFSVTDGGEVLFLWSPETDQDIWMRSFALAEVRVAVQNRVWRLSMAPRDEAALSHVASAPVLALGLMLSLGLSWLVHLLLCRIDLVRRARDRALNEIEERKKAEDALRTTIDERNRALNHLAALSRKVLMAQEDERERLSRELHDELGQLLTALRLEMGWLQKQVAAKIGDDDVAFANTVALAETATNELRQICRGLRPPLLDDLGLEPAVRQLVEEFEERSEVRAHLTLRADDISEATPEVALCAYRILQEALTNVRRHSQAREVHISLSRVGSTLALEVSDDGVGFDPDELGQLQGLGLEGMRERTALVEGELQIGAATGSGTRLRFRAPLGDNAKEIPS